MSALNFKQRLRNIKAVVFDVDGVLTDGKITIHSDNTISRSFFARDGQAIMDATAAGITVAIISAARDESLKTRYLNLGMKEVYLGCTDKEVTLKEFAAVYDLQYDEIMYMGDDLPDYNAMKLAGIAACPYNAAAEIRDICIYISPFNGGEGCVRDVLRQTIDIRL
jgi:3-deoxy-D-manno-octulosonate 8-phosphate phosphatase (KDO 8-P phosphatase)